MSHHQFCLKWENHSNNLLNVFDRLYSNESFTDVTLAAQGRSIRAHKVVLSASSTYFEKLFMEHHLESTCFPGPMIVVMRETSFEELTCIIEFMYKGEIYISQDQLGSLLKTAESLGVKGLAQASQEKNTNGDIATSKSEVADRPSESQKSHNDRVQSSASRKRLRIRRNLEPANDPDDSGSPSDHSQTSSTTFSPRIENVVSMETPRKKTPVNNNSTPIPPNFTKRIASPNFAASFEPILLECDPVQHLQESPTFSSIECDQHPKVKQEQFICDEPFRFFRGHIVYKFNDYIALCHGTRQQYWEEPFTQAVLNGIQDRELDMRKGAQLLGVSYSTLYGRYKYIQP